MLFLLLACKPNTDTHLDTGESLPDCKIQSGEIPTAKTPKVDRSSAPTRAVLPRRETEGVPWHTER